MLGESQQKETTVTVKNYESLSNRENEILRQLKAKLATHGGKGQGGVDKEEFWEHVRRHFGGDIPSNRMGQIAFMAGVKTVNEGGNARYYKHGGPHKPKATPVSSDPKPQSSQSSNNQVLNFDDAEAVEVTKADGGKFKLTNVKMKVVVVIIGCFLLFAMWWKYPIEDTRWWMMIFNKIFTFVAGGQIM